MSKAFIVHLADRGTIGISGADAVKYLNGLVTNEVAHLEEGTAAHAGLLSPQGKILFDFLCLRTVEGFLLDCPAEKATELVKRLSMYKLRAAADVRNLSEKFSVYAIFGEVAGGCPQTSAVKPFRDPRHASLGSRVLAVATSSHDIAEKVNATPASVQAYHAHRISLGVPEGGKDYDFGDAYPHEADLDLFNGVSFRKGCYVGQEVVSRMQHKTVVRKRVVRITGERDLESGSEVSHKGVVFGRVGSTDGRNALALLRLDRYAEAQAASDTVLAGDVPMRVHDADLQRYLVSVEAREKKS
jgi:folate-binding protein YgfZ